MQTSLSLPQRFAGHLLFRRAYRILPLLLPLLLLLAMMLPGLSRPLLERHSWRQVDTASFARGLARGEFDVLHPRFLAYYPDVYGIDGATESEFNLYPLLVAGLYRLVGVHESVARAVSLAFALATALFTYLLGRRYLDPTAAALATAFLGLSPLFVFYGSSVQPEATVLALTLGCLYCFSRWLDSGRRRWWIAAAVLAPLALMTKIPSLYVGLPLLAAAWLRFGSKLLRQKLVWLFAACALLPAAAYYLQAHNIYRETGLTVYGINGGWPGSGKFDNLGQLLSPDFYRVMLSRLRGIILGRYGALLFVVGLALRPRRRDEIVLYAWVAAVTLFILGVAEGNRQHEYYQLPLVPIAALMIGKALSTLLRPETLQVNTLLGRRYLAAALVAGVLLLSLRGAMGNLQSLYEQEPVLMEVAEATRRLTPPDAPVAILHDWARVPEVFYFAERRGWSLWLERTPEGEYGRLIVSAREKTPQGWVVTERLENGIDRLELLREQHASSLVVSLEKGTRAEFERSPVGTALAARYPLIDSAEHWLIYDLRQRQ